MADSLGSATAGMSMAELASTPAAPTPPGVVPNFDASSDRARLYIVLCSVVLSVACMFVLLRLYAKLLILRSPGWDDLCCTIAMIGQTSYTALIIFVSTQGVGKHMWDVSVIELNSIIRYSKIVAIVAEPTIFFTKLSLLLLYYRLFAPDKVTKYAILAGMAFCFTTYTIMMFLYIFLEISKELYVNEAVGAINLVSDVYILCLPIAAVSKLQLPTRKKIGVMMIFFTGLLAVVMSILGLYYRVQFASSITDLTYDLTPVFIVNTIEVDVGIMCTCMPFFPSLVQKSSLVQHFLVSARSLRSRLLRSKATDGTELNVSAKRHKSSKPHRSEENYVELGEGQRLTEAAARGGGVKSFRMDIEGYHSSI